MILKELRLENIRSYAEQAVSFPMGTTLFEGDIGSGKSTILMAIEFALFGLGSEKGGALLKAGSKRGKVTLSFEVDGKRYEVCRSLERKARSVQQSDCSLKTEGTVLQLSASEMKEKVLDILAFNEPADPKAGSVIYRYAIFTPQEEMKAIIWMRADQRLQTLRKAFRIEDYRVALENSSTLKRSIEKKSDTLAAHSSDLESLKEKCTVRKAEIGKCEDDLAHLNHEKADHEQEANTLREKVERLRGKMDLLRRAAGEAPLLEQHIREKNAEVGSLENDLQKWTLQIEEMQSAAEKLGIFELPTAKTDDELKDELRRLREKGHALGKMLGAVDAKISDYASVERDKVCPTCDRPADPKEFEEKIRLKKEEKQKTQEEFTSSEAEIRRLEGLRDSLQGFNEAKSQLRILRERIQENQGRTERNRDKAQKLKNEVRQQEERLLKAQLEIEEFTRVSTETQEFSKKLNEAESELRETEKRISGIAATRLSLQKQVEELEKEIEEKQHGREASERLKEYRMWLEEFFMPTLEAIEKHVMLNINQEFNQNYQKWWSMLVEDPSKESRIDEEFTPLVEQDGYEQDYNYLSGGEKTSLALAYRLSLNTIVQKVSTGMKSNLLILDEPTDGFSKEQLFKIREILDELKSPQVVMVSHEKELESFADQVVKIEKKDGISRINKS